MRMQASLLTSAALTAEVAALKQDLEGSEKELGLAKRQLEENKGNLERWSNEGPSRRKNMRL